MHGTGLTADQSTRHKQISEIAVKGLSGSDRVMPRPPIFAKQNTAGKSMFPDHVLQPVTQSSTSEIMPGHVLKPCSPWHRASSQMRTAATTAASSHPSVVVDQAGDHPTVADVLGIADCTDAAPVQQAAATVSSAGNLPLPTSRLHSKADKPQALHKRHR